MIILALNKEQANCLVKIIEHYKTSALEQKVKSTDPTISEALNNEFAKATDLKAMLIEGIVNDGKEPGQ